MKIYIYGNNGSPTDFYIDAIKGLKVSGGVIKKVNTKSVILEKKSYEEKVERLTINIWDIPLNLRDQIKNKKNDCKFDPKDLSPVDNAILTLVDAGSYDALLAIGSISEHFSENLNDEGLKDQYGNASDLANYTFISKILS